MSVSTSTKETTLHYFRDPLLDVVAGDRDTDLVGVVIVGSPQDNESKYFAGDRVANWGEAMRLDGAIISLDGWGNCHVDFANTIEQLGIRGIPTVGLSFIGNQGLVVENEYMDTIVDVNKSDIGDETGRVGENNANQLDAKKALALLKLKMNRKKC